MKIDFRLHSSRRLFFFFSLFVMLLSVLASGMSVSADESICEGGPYRFSGTKDNPNVVCINDPRVIQLPDSTESNFTADMPVATIWVDETILNMDSKYLEADKVEPVLLYNSDVPGNRSGLKIRTEETGQRYGMLYFDFEEGSLSYGRNMTDNYWEGDVAAYKFKNVAQWVNPATGQQEDLNLIITYSNLHISLQNNLSDDQYSKLSYLNILDTNNVNPQMFSKSNYDTTHRNCSDGYRFPNCGIDNSRAGVKFDINVKIVDENDRLVDGSFYFPMVDIDVARSGSGFGALLDASTPENIYYSEHLLLLSNYGKPTSGDQWDEKIWIPGGAYNGDTPTFDESNMPYLSDIQNVDGKLLISPGATYQNAGAGNRDNDFYTGFATLANNSAGGVNFRIWSSSGSPTRTTGSGSLNSFIMAGSTPVNHRIAASSDEGGTIYTTTTGNADGSLTSGDLMGTDKPNTPYTISAATGQSVTYTMTPELGYRIKNVYVKDPGTDVLLDVQNGEGAQYIITDYTEQPNGTYTYTFSEIKTDQSIHVEWEQSGLAVKKEIDGDLTGDFTFRIQITPPEDYDSAENVYMTRAWTVTQGDKITRYKLTSQYENQYASYSSWTNPDSDTYYKDEYLIYDQGNRCFIGWDPDTGTWIQSREVVYLSDPINDLFSDEEEYEKFLWKTLSIPCNWTDPSASYGTYDRLIYNKAVGYPGAYSNDPGKPLIFDGSTNQMSVGSVSTGSYYIQPVKLSTDSSLSVFWDPDAETYLYSSSAENDYKEVNIYSCVTEDHIPEIIHYIDLSTITRSDGNIYKQNPGGGHSYILTLPKSTAYAEKQLKADLDSNSVVYDDCDVKPVTDTTTLADLVEKWNAANPNRQLKHISGNIYEFTLSGDSIVKFNGLVPFGWSYKVWEADENGTETAVDGRPMEGWKLLSLTNSEGDNFNEPIDNPKKAIFVNAPVVDVAVTKVWDDGYDQDGKRPSTLTIQLLDGSTPIQGKTLTLSDANNWKGKFSDLPYYKSDGTAYDYQVREDETSFGNVPLCDNDSCKEDGYKYEITGTAKEGYVITNTHTPELIDIAITKVWEDDDNRDVYRPNRVWVALYNDGTSQRSVSGIDFAFEKNPDPGVTEEWTVVFKDRPKYKNGEEIDYSAGEFYLPEMSRYKQKGTYVRRDAENTAYDIHFDITNEYEPETVKIPVVKDWDDSNNQDGKRPASVTFQLYSDENGTSEPVTYERGGQRVNVALTLNAAGNWEETFGKNTDPYVLHKYRNVNNVQTLINYTVKEVFEPITGETNCFLANTNDAESKYCAGDPVEGANGTITITNTHIPEKITVRGTKEWVGTPDDYEYPENITIELRANNEAVDHTVGLKTSELNYPWIFPDVDKYASGRLINYTVAEYTVPGFTKSVPENGTWSSDGKELSFVVTNTYAPEKTQLRVSKMWQDEDDRDGIRPGAVTVKLKSDGGTGAVPDYVKDGSGNDLSVILNSANKWSTFFTDLPKYNGDGQEIKYSVEEDNFTCPRVGANCMGTDASAANTGYQMVSITESDAGGYAITNKHIPETISIPVTKSWADDDDRDGIRPRNVGIVIRRTNDGAVAGAVTLTETQLSHTFTGLYKYCSGELCKYTVDEPQVPEGYTMSNAGCVNMTSGICTITNTHTPETVEIEVTKVWDDADNQDGIRPTGNITVTLYKGSGSAKTKVTDSTGADVTVILNPENSWTAKFPVQPAKENKQTIVYSVEESDFICNRINDYCLTGNPDTGYQQTGNAGSAASGFTITNKHNPEKITVKGTKEWSGVPAGYELPESITIELKANNTTVDYTVGLKENSPAYSWSFPNVDKYAGGRVITYTVDEYTVPGFTKDVPTSGTWSADRKELSFVVKNTYDPENTQIRVIKIWTDDENRDGLRPDEITVTLYSDGGTGAAPTAVKSMKLNEGNNWSDYFRDLLIYNAAGQVISYTVDEEQFSCNAIQNCLGTDPKAGYVKSGPVETEAGGYAITNTHTPATIDIPVTKVWADDNDRDGIRPDSVTFIVRRTNDNKVVDDVTLSGTQTTHTFRGLDKYCGEGELCKYTVTEPQVPQGYTMINNQTGVSCVAMTGGSCTITNKHDPEMITIPVTKVWDDMNNTDNSRPEEVVVEVLADDDSLDPKVTITLNDDSTPAWTGTSSPLPKYRDGGTAIVYSLAEYTVENYETSVPAPSDHPEDGYTITNTYAAQTQPLVIRKTWVYNNAPTTARLSLREFLAKITVLIDGNKYYFADVQTSGSGYTAVVNGTPVTITATGTDTANWTVTISGLPKNKWDAGQEKSVAISYSIAEDPITNYYTEYGEPFDAENGFPISNKYNVTEVTVTKSWVDDNDSRGDRPESVLIHLHGSQDGSLREQSISAANAVSGDSNTWSYTFTNLPKYDSNGKEITYYSHEVNVDHYISTVSADKLTITNTWTDVRQINIYVNKYWDDDNNRDGKRPDSVTFNLLVDGVQQDSMTVTGPAWTGVFGPLPYADESGTPINYSVTEDTVVDKDGKNSYTPKAGDPAGSIQNGLIFTNSRAYETVKIRMTKTWDDFSNMYNLRGEQPLKLLQRFRLIFGTVQYSLDNLTMTQQGDASTPYLYTASVQGYPVTITASGVTDTSNSWTVEIDGLPKYKNGSVIDYDITENPDTYAFTRTKESSTEENTFVFTGENFLNMQRGVLTKVWEDENNKDGKRPTDPMKMLEGIKLYANGEYYLHGAFTLKDHEEGSKVWTYTIAAHPNVLATVEDTNNNQWKMTVDKLPRVLNGKTVAWTVSEEMDGYDSFVNGLTVTNVPQVSVDVTKVWVDGDNQDGIRPATVTVNLFKGSGSSKTQVKDEEGRDVTLTLSEGNNWTGSFTGLPKYETENGAPKLSAPINYSVEEQTTDVLTGTDGAGTYAIKVEGTMTEGYTITNTHTPELIDITLSKVWDDNNNQDGKRAVASVQLFANGAAVSGKTLTVPVTDSWTENNKFTGLPKYRNGVKINYEIREIPPAGYTPSIAEGNGIKKSFVITNTYSSETVNVPVSKVWNDENDQDGLRAKLTATVMLYANGAEVSGKRLKVGKTDGWSDAFTGLPKYDGGQAITYTVQETITYDSSVTGTPYTITVTGNMTAGFTITNSHTPAVRDVTITKVWDDANNQDGLRRDNVTFNLYQNDNIYRTITSDSIDSPWTYTWNDLPTNCGGSACVYTVDEPTVPRPYTKSIDQTTLTVTNSYTPETVTVQGSKTWVDNDNRAGKRPATIYIQLWKNGALYVGSGARKTITAATEEIEGTPWSWKWEGLPKFENGQEIQWSVLEENVSDYQASYPSAYNVTNTYNEGTKSISVKKVWNDDENRDGIRPTYIYVDLYADGVKTTQSKALADANSWLNTFTDLPIYKEGATGVEIVYTVKEANAVSGYSISEPVFDSTTNTFTITNTHTPATTTVQGSKTWVQRELDTNPPSQILIHLYADGTLVDGKDKTITVDSKELDGTTPWSWKWEGLPKYKQGEVGKEIVYTVRETPITGYNTTLNSPNVTNTYSPGKTSLSVRKAWVDGNNQDGIRPGHVEVALLSKVGTADFSPTGQTAILVPDSTTPNLWRVHTFENLDRFTSTGQPITYSVKEIGAITGYTSSEPILDENSGVYVITNTHTPDTITITGEKVWDNDDDPTKPTSVTIHLLANGTEVSGKSITVTKDTKMVDDKAWTWKWEGLPKYANGQEITYTVSEDTLDDYTLTVQRTPAADGKSISFVLTNTYDPGMITVRVQKVWQDNNNQDGIRPTTVEVKLIADGNKANPVATATLPQEGIWRARFNVPEYRDIDNKIKYVYTVEETATTVLTGTDGPGTYTQTVTGDVENGFVITNIHTPVKINITGTKTWVGDENAPEGTRPDYITLELLANGSRIATTVGEKANGYAWAFNNLNKYANGTEITYAVSEFDVPGYEQDVKRLNKTETGMTYSVTNTYSPEYITLRVTKRWDDNNNQDGYQPDSVTVNLYKGEGASKTQVLDSNDQPVTLVLKEIDRWTGTFRHLPKYENGVEIVYTVDEAEFTNFGKYTKTISGSMAEGYIITNSHTPEKISITGTKTWVGDENAPEGTRPDYITLELKANGTRVATTVGEKANNYAWSFTNLDKFANRSTIDYVVTEFDVPGYERNVQLLSDTGTGKTYSVTNTYSPDTTTLRVTKRWDDNNNQDGYRPTAITVNLYKGSGSARTQVLDNNNQPVTLTLNENGRWTGTFQHLPKYEGGVEIVYSVDEADFDNIDKYTKAITGDMAQGYLITNTHEPETVYIHGTKSWSGDDDAPDGTRPEYVTFELRANGNFKLATVAQGPDYNWSFPLQPRYSGGQEISYMVMEYAVPGYDASSQDEIEDYEQTYAYTNTYNPGKTSLTVTKNWADNNNQDGLRPARVAVQLVADGTPVPERFLVLQGTGSSWTGTFNDLDIYPYGSTIPIVYTVQEVGSYDGYTSSISCNTTGNTTGACTVTNTHNPAVIKVEGAKTWNDNDNVAGKRPASIEITLNKNGSKYEASGITNPVTVSAEESWKWSWTNLPKFENGKEITWSVKEKAVENYDTSYSGYDVINSYDEGTTSVNVTKAWNDSNNQDGKRPSFVTVALYADGVATGKTLPLGESNNFTNTFTGLPIYKEGQVGQKIIYTVKETTTLPAGYTTADPTGTAETGFTITNSYTPEKVAVSGSKTWMDNEDAAGARPSSITIRLLKNNTEYAQKTVTATDGWKWEWKDLPKFENGTQISWTITEDNVEDYTRQVSGYNVTNTYNPGKTSIRVSKSWKDADNQDGIRPQFVRVHLLANGADTGKEGVLTAPGWSYLFEDLDRNLTYTVVEDVPTGYTAAVTGTAASGFTVTNTHIPETVRIVVTKTWDDAGNEGNRPETIKLYLHADGTRIAHDEFTSAQTAEPGWKWEINDRPKYKNGGTEIVYTIIEDSYEDYTRSVSRTVKPKTETEPEQLNLAVTNKWTPGKTSIMVEKSWVDNDNQDGIRPDWVLVNLLDGNKNVVASDRVTKANNWILRFNNIDEFDASGKRINYTVEEVYDRTVTESTDGPGTYKFSGVNPIVGGFEIVNTHRPETVSISGTKTWDDNDNQDGKRPASITINLLKNGAAYQSKMVTETDGWAYSWTDLPKYENGSPITWSLTETPVEGYTRTWNGSSVTNTYDPDSAELTVVKSWDDNYNQDGLRPSYARVYLYADGVKTDQYAILIASNKWTYRFTGLDKFKDGKQIVYTVKEEDADIPNGYTVSYSDDIDSYITVTNTHKPETVKVVVTKTWDDAGNESKRPTEVNLYLDADGKQIRYQQFTSAETAAAGWKWEIDNLPKYKNGGTEISYTIRENTYPDYSRSVSHSVTPATDTEKELLNIAVTNKWTPGKTTIAVQKKWTDTNDQDGIRPTWVLVNLLDGSKNVVASGRVTKENNWILRFENIDQYDASGNPIQYSVEEVYDRTITEDTDGPGTYKLAGIKTIEGGFEIENEHTPETVTVSGTKTWNDNDNQDGKRPTSITIRLLKNNVEYDSKTVIAADGWKWEWTKLPKYENGKQITWSINENDVIDYTKVVSGYNVTNTYDPGKINIHVNKVWHDENDQDGLRQLNVTVFLKANGETVATGVLNEASGWSYVFMNQDRNKDGKAITYTVEELHTAFITGTDGPGTYQDVVTGDTTKGFTITNTHTPETVTLKGTKTWVGTELDPEAPTELKVHLYANGTEVTAQAKIVTAADDWKWQWTNLPKYANGKEITYTMSEDTDYTKRVVREGDTFNVTNTYNPDEITILIRKVWNDNNNQDGIRPPWTLVNLKGNGETVASEFLNDGNEWRVRIDVPQYDENQQEIKYTVEEVFTRTVTEDTDGPGTYKLESINGNAKDGFTITNKHTPETVDVAGSKTWNDNDNAAGMRPSSIKIQLNKNGVAYGAAKNVTEADGWKWEWKKVPKYDNGQLISWSINEENVEGYSKTVTGYNVTNTYTPDETVVTVRKAWNDKDNQDGLRTDHSRVYLLADGERTGDEGILIAANEWVYRFRRLPVMKDGKKIVYTVEEDPVPAGYTASYSGDQDKGLVVTNTHDPETVKIVVTKTWDDAGNEANRPENVNLYLQADGATIRNGQFTSDETAAVGWKWEIDNLPKFKNGGTAIAYTIVENDSGEYSRSVERSVTPKTDTEKEQLNLHVTNKWTPGTTSIVVEKEWSDNGNQDGIRPPWILVNLLDGEGNVVQSGRLTAENNWLLRFEGVEEFDESGQKIAYSVEEVYDNVITKETDGPGTYRLIRVREIAGGFEIENGHTPETVTVSGAKTWNDEDNESARPESITIRVLGDGAEVAHKEVTASDDWKWEFSGLPKYKAGKLITYTITEDAIPNYTPQINGFNVTNTYEEGVTSVSVKKVWSDGNNQDGLRDWVVIKLLANGEETEHMTVLSDSNHWEHTFTRLPAMAGGEAIVYTVDEEKNSRITGEDGPGTYKIDIQGDQTAGFIVNNIHTPETVTISGHKTWDDNNNENQARPKSIFVHLHDENERLQRVEISEATNWTWTFENLPKYANGKEIQYSVHEEAVENYTPTQNGYDITNTYDPGKISVSVTKVWNDDNNRDNLRPTWILVKLLENGEESGMMAVLNERNSWKHTFTNLDVSKDGQPVSYSVAEELGGVLSDTDTAETYGYIINGNAAEGYVITNKHTPVTTSVSVTKSWDDGDDRDGKRPAEVLIRLYANRVQIDQDYIRPDEEGKWTLSFTNLPKNENGKPISYTVEEMPIEDYSTVISGDASTGYTITNSYTPGETSLTVTKRWEDDSNRDGKRPASAVIHLLADGDEVNSFTLAANNNWQHTFTGLPVNKDGVKIVYTVTEDAVEGYSAPVVKGDAENGFTVINAYHPQTINIPVTKVWDDGEDQDGKRPESVTVRLLADGAEVANTTLPLEGVWSYTFTGLPVYQNGKEINYTLTEDSVEDYTTSIIGTASVGFTVTNSYEPGKTSLSVAKRWEDADNQDGIRPEAVTVTLLANGQPTDQVVKLNAENNWRHEFESLDEYADGVKIAYSVSEEAVTGYTTTIEGETATGYTIVNAHTPENIAVRGVKVWNDNDNAAGARPESIIVRLHANEVEIDSQSVHADEQGNWEWAFRGLPKYADEREIRYTITEDAPEQYSAEITGNAKDGFTITNTYAENKTSLFVSKHWTDFYDNDGKRPASVEVKVLADYGDGNGYVETEYSGVITGPDWELIINDLPLTVDGVRVKYKVAEETIPGYTAVVEGDPVTGYMITNVHELETVTVSGQKTWNDNNNSAQARPEAIVVRLNSDGTLLHEIRVTAEDDWKWSFSGLPKYQGGREIVYTIHENPVDNYTPSVDGYNITNNYTSGKRSLPIDAAWLDQNNRDGLRPGSVTIKLFADGEDTGKTLVLDESNGWRDRFTDLPICSANPKWLVSKAPSYEDICAAEGKKHVVYTIQEVHTDVITGENTETTYADEYVGSSQEGWTVINRHTPVKINVEGTKTWSGGSADSRPESITVRLFNGNNEIDHRTVTEAEGWSWSFTDLWKYENGEEIRYVISEDAVTDYTAKVDGYNITNTYSPSHTDVTVRKEWDDSNNAEGLRPEYVMVNLLSNGTVFANAELRDSNGWTHTFQNLPIADASGPITYDVAEVTVPGYTVRKSGDSTQGFTIYNVRIQETIDIPVRKVWSGVGEKPASLTIALVVNGVRSDQTIVLTAAEGWSGSFNGLAAGNTYSVEELDVPEGYTCTVSGSAQTGFTVTNKIKTPPTPPEPPHFFRLTGELPETGITTVGGNPLSSKPASVNYLPTTMELQLPTLDIMSSIVTIEPIDGRYPVEWLGYEAGLLDGTAKPGEGISVIAAHNTLNSEDYGPFALIMNMEEGDRFFVTDDDGSILIFQVYANEKIGSHDYDGLWKVASEYDNTLTLLTCEDERAEGGYASRRAVAARRVN